MTRISIFVFPSTDISSSCRSRGISTMVASCARHQMLLCWLPTYCKVWHNRVTHCLSIKSDVKPDYRIFILNQTLKQAQFCPHTWQTLQPWPVYKAVSSWPCPLIGAFEPTACHTVSPALFKWKTCDFISMWTTHVSTHVRIITPHNKCNYPISSDRESTTYCMTVYDIHNVCDLL